MPKQRKRDGVYWRKDRGGWWVSFVDASGKRRRKPLPDANNAVEARDRRPEVKKEANRKPGEACQDSFADVADKFLAYQKPRLTPKAYEREEGIVVHLKASFPGRLADITSSAVSDFLTAALGRVSKSSAKKELGCLKHLFRLACGEWKLLPRFSDPTLDVKGPKVRDERTQHLTPDQFRLVLATAPEKMKPIFALLTATGMRCGELVGCRWKYVNGSRILLPISKNDDPKEVHLNLFAQQILASIPQGEPEDLLFPDVTPESVSMAFRRVCRILKITDIRLHDLRHTFATWLRQRGVELDVIASQLGHRDLRMTKRYARIASAQVKRAVDGLDSVLSVTQEGEKALVSHPFVTGLPALPEVKPVTH